MITNAFQPMVLTANAAVLTTIVTITPAYATPNPLQLCSYRLVNVGNQIVFFLFGASPAVTVANGIPIAAGASETFTGPPNSVIQTIASATGSTLYVTVGEGM